MICRCLALVSVVDNVSYTKTESLPCCLVQPRRLSWIDHELADKLVTVPSVSRASVARIPPTLQSGVLMTQQRP